jgi:upstream activation factor subunit UAF30
MDVQAVTQSIKAILTAPGVDLSTISSKRVRAQLSETYGAALIKQNKEVRKAVGPVLSQFG